MNDKPEMLAEHLALEMMKLRMQCVEVASNRCGDGGESYMTHKVLKTTDIIFNYVTTGVIPSPVPNVVPGQPGEA